ncbi:MAG: hypothetical protein ABJA74_00815 [Lapillicoccus sp.]
MGERLDHATAGRGHEVEGTPQRHARDPRRRWSRSMKKHVMRKSGGVGGPASYSLR